MALETRRLLFLRQQLQQAVANAPLESAFLQEQLDSDRRQLRGQIDALDRARSSREVMGVVIDTYRAEDSPRNPNHFNRGRL